VVALWLVQPVDLTAQVLAEPILTGQVMVGDTALTSGTVVLHHVSNTSQGEVDSVAVARDGSFVLRLPRVPDPALEEMYFASIRHDGVMYFGNAITVPVDLDSLYVIHAYDTLWAPAEGVPVALEARNVFFEPNGSQWAVTDLFSLRNDRGRTIVPREGAYVWRYPLPVGAREVVAEREMSADVVTYEGGDVVFRGVLPPGERTFVLRYLVDSLEVTLPTPGETEVMAVLVREPAPSLEVGGLTQGQSVQLEVGVNYRVFSGENVVVPQVRISMVEETEPPPVEWIAVLLALVLAGGGLLAFRGGARASPAAAPRGAGRQALLVELARLDEQYESEKSPAAARTNEYRRRRSELMERLRSHQ
jgi:hypothetical protein